LNKINHPRLCLFKKAIMIKKNKSLKDLLLIHELAFILLIILAAAAGAIGIHLWEKSSQEASRISMIVTEVQQTRGDLYRQMKELFDAYFLDDSSARIEYANFTVTVEAHFLKLKKITVSEAEKAAINDLHENYKKIVIETPALFDQYRTTNSDAVKRVLNTEIETGLFKQYEEILSRTEKLLNQKQFELDSQLKSSKRTSIILLIIPLVLAVLLLLFSRIFLKRAIVKPLNNVLKATSEISAGKLTHRAPNEGIIELAAVSRAINEMADQLAISQDTLVRTEKQAAQGLLVPMLAHNIRNPLASIRATAQVMEDPDHDTETRISLRGIIDTVDRLERWTGALLAYLLPLKPQPSYTNIKDIVDGALAPLKLKFTEKSIQLILPTWTENIIIFTDQHLLEQVIYNLILNAIDASNKNSLIEISLKVNPTEFNLILLDQGCGMPFTPDPSAVSAPTTKRFGTGLGIPFAFKVCDVLGGELNFKSRNEGGTAVTIYLPKNLNLSIK
jgi:signal transduction histidine kinase